MSPIDGRGKTGRVQRLYTFGVRSFSVRKAANANLLFDSFGEVERHIAERYPKIFNSGVILDQLISNTIDLTSDNSVI